MASAFLLAAAVMAAVTSVEAAPEEASWLGKRLASAPKNSRPKDLYSFGIGKRSVNEDELAEVMAEEAAAEGVEKRDPYAFGLGKKSDSPLHHFKSLYGKKDAEAGDNPYAFGLGKRAAYNF